MKYSIGDRVRFLDFEGEGRIVAVFPSGFLEIEVEGMRMRVSAREVALAGGQDGEEERHLYDANSHVSRFKHPAVNKVYSGSGTKQNGSRDEVTEVDLHMDKIRRNYPAARNVHDDMALHVQLEVFERAMAEAFRKGTRTVVFIHGNGRGVLRSELMKRLREYSGVEVREASWMKYGSGALEVTIR